MSEPYALALVADSIIPGLGLAAGSIVLKAMLKGSRRLALVASAALVGGLAMAFGLRLLDDWRQWWPGLGLDYSTHTAVALVLVLYLLTFCCRASIIWLTLLGGYGALMVYLGYHTLADLLTTAAPITALYGPPLVSLRRRNRFCSDSRLP